MNTILSKEQLETTKELIKQGYTLKKLGEYFGQYPSSISRVLKKAGIEYNLEIKKISKIENIFSVIDTELKAYLLGFFVADGCVYDTGRFGLCIAEQDLYIIELFKASIAPDSFIKINDYTKGAKNRQKQLFLRISSKVIVEDIKKYGIGQRKTYSKLLLPDITNELKWHFIRGYFDGDGHLGIRTLGKYKTCRIGFVNGDKTILQSIKEFTGFGIIRERKGCWRLDIESIIDCKMFLEKMYNNSNFKLPRKFNKYLLVNAEVFAKSKKIANSVTHRS